jgi:hypothetical protein
MPNSPLDGSFESSKKKLKPKWVLAIFALFATVIGGGVFAATILINTNTDIEFGQGVAEVTACDGDVTLTPYAAFDGTTFKLDEIVISNVDDACDSKTFTVGVYQQGVTTPLEEWTQVVNTPIPLYTLTSTIEPPSNDIFNITIESN